AVLDLRIWIQFGAFLDRGGRRGRCGVRGGFLGESRRVVPRNAAAILFRHAVRVRLQQSPAYLGDHVAASRGTLDSARTCQVGQRPVAAVLPLLLARGDEDRSVGLAQLQQISGPVDDL